VDAARGVAILMMVLYHLVYDLDTFGGFGIGSTTGFWGRFADATAFAFVFLAGVSLAISRSRVESTLRGWDLFGKYLRRGLRILGYAMALTAVSWSLGMGIIAFGILHLIGVSIILAYPFLQLRLPNLILGLSLAATGWYMRAQNVSSESPWLLPFGVVPENLSMPDYRPLLPWFGVVLLGLFVGNVLYRGGKRVSRTSGTPSFAGPLAFLGRNSLFIYLVHQPVMVALLWALGIVNLGSI
jgi:uncharacterized membrane protein